MENRTKDRETGLTQEELEAVSGGQNRNVILKDVGMFLIREGSRLGVNDASVPAGCGLEIGDLICVCPQSGEAKDVVSYHDYKSTYGLPVIYVGRFLSGNAFGDKQLVRVRVY